MERAAAARHIFSHISAAALRISAGAPRCASCRRPFSFLLFEANIAQGISNVSPPVGITEGHKKGDILF